MAALSQFTKRKITMNMKRLFTLLAFSVASFCLDAQATQAAQKVTIKSEIASPVVLENAQEKNYLKISLTGFPLEIRKRSPINLALVIDRSGSMNGERIEKARDAAIMAVNMLDTNDTLSIVAFDSTVQVIAPVGKVKDKQTLSNKIRKIRAGGMTALFAGVSKGIDQIGKHLDNEQVNRIILLSDGHANVGPASISELSSLAKIAAKKGVAITTLGIGKDYDEDLMTAIASYSDGNHVFVEKSVDLEKTFASEFNDVMSVVAQEVEVVIKTANQVTPVRLLGRDGEIKGNTVTVKLNQLYSKQEKYVLLEVIPAKGARSESKALAEVTVNYNNLESKRKDTYQESLTVRYTDSKAEMKEAIVEEVLVDSAIQKTAIQNEQAVRLIDEGKMDEAKALLDQGAEELEAMPVSTPMARQKIMESASKNKSMGEKMMKDEKSVSRKALKEQNYNMQKQIRK
jgi:Ca-activated chloride channel family protein